MSDYTLFEILIFLIPAVLALAGIGWRWLTPRVPEWAVRRLELAGREVVAAFAYTKQRYADEKRKRSTDGRLTDEERAEALAMTMRALREQISLDWLGQALARVFGVGGESAAEAWLERQVEAAVALAPTFPPPPPPPPPPGLVADPTEDSRRTAPRESRSRRSRAE